MIKHLMSVLLFLSLAMNIYLYLEASRWEQAWLAQFITTSDVEVLLKSANPSLTYENVAGYLKLAPDEGGKEVLKYGSTTFQYENGHYSGSKADLPDH